MAARTSDHEFGLPAEGDEGLGGAEFGGLRGDGQVRVLRAQGSGDLVEHFGRGLVHGLHGAGRVDHARAVRLAQGVHQV